MAADRYTPTERLGVNAVEAIVLSELKWIFREQPIADMGIDAHIERVDDGDPTGKLMGLQIKTGKGNFHETATGWVYYLKEAHLDYWTGHSLPVLLVAHFLETKETLWVEVREDLIEKTKKGWKIEIPKTAVFGSAALSKLRKRSEGTPQERKLRELAINEPLMRHVQAGLKVSVGLEDWINKSLSRSDITIYVHDANGNETVAQEWLHYWTGYSLSGIVERLFPWFTAKEVDVEFYNERWYQILSGLEEEAPPVDEEGEIYPYEREVMGEVDRYRLKLELNELGEAYLVVADHLNDQ